MLTSPAISFIDVHSPKAGRVALKGFFSIAKKWKLASSDQMVLLGDLPKSTFHAYKKLPEVALNRDLLERISYVIGIYKALHILLQNKDHADAWVHQPNQAEPFHGQSALERMKGGSIVDLAVVRQYLDAQRGW